MGPEPADSPTVRAAGRRARVLREAAGELPARLLTYREFHPELAPWVDSLDPAVVAKATYAKRRAAWDAVLRCWLATNPTGAEPNRFWLDLMSVAYITGLTPHPLPSVPDPNFVVPDAPWVPDSEDGWRDLSVSHHRLGDLALGRSDFDSATCHYRKGLGIERLMVELAPQSRRAMRGLANSHDCLGHVAAGSGDFDAAAHDFEAALDLRERLLDLAPGSPEALRNLVISYENLGDLAMLRDDLDSASEQYQAGIYHARNWVERSPDSVQALRLLSVFRDRAGDLLMQQGMLNAAGGQYQRGQKLRERWVELAPRSTEALWALSVSHDNVGDLLVELGNSDAARSSARRCYQTGLQVRERLLRLAPRSTLGLNGLTLSHQRLGRLAEESGDIRAATDHCREGLTAARRLARRDPSSPDALVAQAIFYQHLGDLAGRRGDIGNSEGHYLAGLEPFANMSADSPRDADVVGACRVLIDRLLELEAGGDHALRPETVASMIVILERFRLWGGELDDEEAEFCNRHRRQT